MTYYQLIKKLEVASNSQLDGLYKQLVEKVTADMPGTGAIPAAKNIFFYATGMTEI